MELFKIEWAVRHTNIIDRYGNEYFYWWQYSSKKYTSIRRALQAIDNFKRDEDTRRCFKFRIVHYYENT